MQTRKLLIADGTEDFRLALQAALQSAYCVRSCRDGKEALELIQSFNPDILVLDLMLPELDGISLLQAAVASGSHPMVLATSRLFSDYVLDSMEQLGVGYLMRKPCDIHAMVARINDLGQRIHAPAAVSTDFRVQISNILLSLGISTKHRGYTYLMEAVLLMIDQPDQAITKELYPAVGAACGVKGSHVEHCIRTAIAAAWTQRNDHVWQQYCRRDAGGALRRPSNADLISRLANSLRLNAD